MLALAATLAIQALVAMASLTPPILAPLAAPAIGVSASQTGLLVALIYAAACLASMSSGALLRRFGAMRLSQVCLVLCGIGIALFGAADLVLIGLGAIILRFGYGPLPPP